MSSNKACIFTVSRKSEVCGHSHYRHYYFHVMLETPIIRSVIKASPPLHDPLIDKHELFQ